MNGFFLERIEALKPVEVTFSAYLLFSALVIVLTKNRIEHWIPPIVFRALILSLFAALLVIKQNQRIEYLRIFLPFLFIGYLYSETDVFNNLIFSEYFDRHLAVIDYRIFGFQPSIEFSKHIPSRLFSELMFFGYFSYFAITIGLPSYIYLRIDKKIGEKFASIIINSFLIFYILFSLFPVAGPQYYFSKELIQIPSGFVFEPIIRFVQFLGERPTGAFPSSHVSICFMLLWGCGKLTPRLLFIIIPVSVLLILSTIFIGAHYATDVIAGIVVTPIVYKVSERLYNLLN